MLYEIRKARCLLMHWQFCRYVWLSDRAAHATECAKCGVRYIEAG